MLKSKIHNILNDFGDKSDYFYSLGYRRAGPLFLGFIFWLHEIIRIRGNDRIFFLSRDGKIVKKLFDLVNDSILYRDISTVYLYASRRAMLIPGINNIGESGFVMRDLISSWWVGNRVVHFFDRLGIKVSTKLLDKYSKKVGFKSCYSRVNADEYSKLERLFLLFESKLTKRGGYEYATLTGYLDQKLFFKSKNPAVVDIGWGGSMQRKLGDLYRIHSDLGSCVDGYYLGVNSRISQVIVSKQIGEGYLFPSLSEEIRMYLIWQSAEILEFIFSAQHPSILYFKRCENRYSPVFSKFNNGAFYRRAAAKVQEGIVGFFDSILHSLDSNDISELSYASNELRDYLCSFLYKMVLNPNDSDVNAFRRIKHMPGLGETKIGRYIVEDSSLFPNHSPYEMFERAYWERGYMSTKSNLHLIRLFLFNEKFRQRFFMYKTLSNTPTGKAILDS